MTCEIRTPEGVEILYDEVYPIKDDPKKLELFRYGDSVVAIIPKAVFDASEPI